MRGAAGRRQGEAVYAAGAIPRDAAFPQLEQLGDPRQLARVLQRRLGARFASGELQILDCSVSRVDSRRGRHPECWLQLRAEICDRPRRERGEQRFSAQLLPPEGLLERYERARRAAAVAPAYGDPICLVPEWSMILWAHPNDPALAALPWLADPARVLAAVRAAPARFGLEAGETATSCEVELCKYVPARRCSAQLRIGLGGPPGERRVHAKAFRADAAGRAHGIARGIALSPEARSGALRVARPFGLDPELGILFQEALPGAPLSRLFSERDLCAEAEQAGRALGALHRVELALPERCGVSEQIAELAAKGDRVLRSFPRAASRIAALRERLVAQADGLEPAPLVTVHGSFKPSHVMVADSGVALIDLDGASRGDAAYDLGRFAAHLLDASLAGSLDRARADAQLRALLGGHARSAERPVPERRWRWFAASHLLTSQLYKAVKRIDLGRSAPLVALAEELLACP